MLISVHIPKTAGTSFRLALEEHYGERILFDYGDDRPLTDTPEQERIRQESRRETRRRWPEITQRYDAIHGHFRADKYLFARDGLRIATFFREPAARTLSFYRHFMRHPDTTAPLAERARAENMDFQAFARQPEVISFYRLFLDGLTPRDFDFVGITERYDQSIALFNRMFETSLTIMEANRAPGQEPVPALPESITGPNARIYEDALRRFDELYRQYFPGGM